MWYAEICEPGAQIFCPICGTNNIQTEPNFKLTECKHLESITTSLAFGEFEIDKNDIFQEVFSKYDADHSLEIAEFVEILKQKLGNEFVLFETFAPAPSGATTFFLYRFDC